MTATLHVVSGRMTPSQYDEERAAIEPTKQAAGIRWEQELASLFHRSGWTQEELANREEKSRTYIVRLLTFGRFLAFVGNVPIGTSLSEGRFRDYWARTADKGGGNERIRFQAIVTLIEAGARHIPKGYPKRIVEQFGDRKWHSLSRIAKALDAPEDEVERSLAGMAKDGRGDAKTEVKDIGLEKHYRIFRNARMINSEELTEKLMPIIKGIEAEAAKNQVRVSPAALGILAGRLRKLLDELG